MRNWEYTSGYSPVPQAHGTLSASTGPNGEGPVGDCPLPATVISYARAGRGRDGYGRDTAAGSKEPQTPWRPSDASGMITDVSPKFAQVRSDALELTDEERARLADELYESVEESDGTPEEIAAAWGEEIARRLKKLDDGTAVLIDGAEHERRLRAKYGL